MLLLNFFKKGFLSGCFLCSFLAVASQDPEALNHKVFGLPDKLFNAVNNKTQNITERLNKQMEKYLSRLAKEEKRLKTKLAGKDSAAAAKLFDEAEKQYGEWRNKIRSGAGEKITHTNNYIPHLDTLKTAFDFIAKTQNLLNNSPIAGIRLAEATGKINMLQQKYNQAEQVKNFIKLRRQILKDQLQRYGLSKNMARLNKQVYYYQAQLKEYKQMINDPSLLEAKLIKGLQQTKVFRNFFNKHSQLASLFRLPDNATSGSVGDFAGLQTRNDIQRELVQRFGSTQIIEPVMQQQVWGAKSRLNQLKNKINQMGGASGDFEMPDFKPNNQKTKRIKNRLEFGTNVQTVRSNRFFPSTTDFGLSVGYKLNDKSIAGIGSSYKLGWGRSIRNIAITHEGIGVRSFADYKIKGNFWLSAGAEMNYRSRFHDFDILKNYSAWQKSALVGVSKKYQVSKKLKGNMQLMHDFLWKEQVPRGQAVVFRVGYYLK